MLRFVGVTKMYRMRNKIIRGTAQVEPLEGKFREVRLKPFGHVHGSVTIRLGCQRVKCKCKMVQNNTKPE